MADARLSDTTEIISHVRLFPCVARYAKGKLLIPCRTPQISRLRMMPNRTTIMPPSNPPDIVAAMPYSLTTVAI